MQPSNDTTKIAPGPVLANGTVAHDAAPKKGSKRPLFILGGLVALMVLGIGGYALLTADEESTDDAQVEGDVVPLASRVGGQVLHVRVEENKAVKKGAVLFEIDDADYAARVKQAEAELATAQAQAAAADAQFQVAQAGAKGGFTSAKAGVSGSSAAVASASAQIANAEAQLARAQADARRTEQDLKRAQSLFADRAIAQQALDNAQAAADSAQASLAAARAQVSAAHEQKRAAETNVEAAKGRFEQSNQVDAQLAAAKSGADLGHARVKSSEAMLTLAQNQLAYTKVIAPEDGIVSKLGVHEGQLVQMGQPLVELVPDQTYVVANFKETQLGRIKPGQKVEVKVDAFGGKKLTGKVESISGGTGSRFSLLPPDNASGNFVKVVQRVPVRIAWVDAPKELLLRAGLSADVTVYVK
jgi:membrane fusion protein (multidrug efflux system)